MMSNHLAWTSSIFHHGAAGQLPPATCGQDLVLRHLRTPQDIDEVRALRGHIDLATVCAVDPLFEIHEKKETRWASRLPSNAGARLSGRFGQSTCVSA